MSYMYREVDVNEDCPHEVQENSFRGLPLMGSTANYLVMDPKWAKECAELARYDELENLVGSGEEEGDNKGISSLVFKSSRRADIKRRKQWAQSVRRLGIVQFGIVAIFTGLLSSFFMARAISFHHVRRLRACPLPEIDMGNYILDKAGHFEDDYLMPIADVAAASASAFDEAEAISFGRCGEVSCGALQQPWSCNRKQGFCQKMTSIVAFAERRVCNALLVADGQRLRGWYRGAFAALDELRRYDYEVGAARSAFSRGSGHHGEAVSRPMRKKDRKKARGIFQSLGIERKTLERLTLKPSLSFVYDLACEDGFFCWPRLLWSQFLQWEDMSVESAAEIVWKNLKWWCAIEGPKHGSERGLRRAVRRGWRRISALVTTLVFWAAWSLALSCLIMTVLAMATDVVLKCAKVLRASPEHGKRAYQHGASIEDALVLAGQVHLHGATHCVSSV